jgi:hypothetical protein
MGSEDQTPPGLWLNLDQALELLTVLENTRDFLVRLAQRQPLRGDDLVAPLEGVRYQIGVLHGMLGFPGGKTDAH